MTFAVQSGAADTAADIGEKMQWSSNFHTLFNQPQSNNSSSVSYEFAIPLPGLGSHLDLGLDAPSKCPQLPSNQSDLSTQATHTFHASQAQASDFGTYYLDNVVHPRQQNEPNESFSSFGAKPMQIGTFNPYEFLINNNLNNYCGVSNGFQDFSSVPANAGGSSTFVLPFSAPDPSWTRSSIELATSNQKGDELEAKSKKRRRALGELRPHSQWSAKNKRQKRTAATCSDEDQVGAVEAAFFEDWLLKFPSVYPGEKHFKALAELTPQPLNVETVRSWFAQKWHRSKMLSVGADKRPVGSSATASTFFIQASRQRVARSVPHSLLTGVLLEASTWVRDHKRTKCIPERDLAVLARDPDKLYCCTLKCGTKFKDKDDWRKHEEVNYPQEGWVCDLGSVVVVDGRTLCSFCGIHDPSIDHVHDGKSLCHSKAMRERGRLHFRKQHFIQHFNNIHPKIPRSQYLESNHFTVESKFPRLCGFCPYEFTHWRDRIDHIGNHYIAGKEVTEWQETAGEDDKDDVESEASDDDCRGGFNSNNSGSPDHMSGSSDDDSDDPSGPSNSRQRCHVSSGRMYSQQGYHLAAFDLFCSSLARVEHVTRLNRITTMEFLPTTPLTRAPYVRVRLMRHVSKSNIDSGRDILNNTLAHMKRKELASFSSTQIDPNSTLYSHPPMLPRLQRSSLANETGDQSDTESVRDETDDEICNNLDTLGIATGQLDALVIDAEIKVNARKEDVGSSTRTSHGSGSPRPETSRAFEESEILTEIDRLRVRTTYLEDSNKYLTIALQVAEASVKDLEAEGRRWKEEFVKLDAGRALLQNEVDRMRDELRKKNWKIKELTNKNREPMETSGRASINNNDEGLFSSTMDSRTSRSSGSISQVSSTVTLESGHSMTARSSGMRYSMPFQNISTSIYATGGPVQQSSQHYHSHSHHQPNPLSQTAPPALSVRASSGSWTPTDDSTLMSARAQGLNWAPIQAAYFPSKTPNACRKRHERLMDRRNSDDWSTIKLENFAKEYMGMRREIWQLLAARTGEKWNSAEAKCMSLGVKNLQSAARACCRRERLESGDSGIVLERLDSGDLGIGLPERYESGDSGIGLPERHESGDSGIGLPDESETGYVLDNDIFGRSPLPEMEHVSAGYTGSDSGRNRQMSDGRKYL